ncbi:hypothetical protein AAFF_G00399500 [Aldrovandia affinis]|uniref:CG-1 domain-containing protein n=1 Tax=Aldrovandia affinis TaxID=143900 RepID=A0AAD7WKD7_9TELE|nr:hypothetical protein AAFF_G00399500 [Aldrovandia affinis]
MRKPRLGDHTVTCLGGAVVLKNHSSEYHNPSWLCDDLKKSSLEPSSVEDVGAPVTLICLSASQPSKLISPRCLSQLAPAEPRLSMIHERFGSALISSRSPRCAKGANLIEGNAITAVNERLLQDPIRPQNGSMILYNRKKVKYRKDGYCWKKRKDGKTTREDHMKLKVQGVEVAAQPGPKVALVRTSRLAVTLSP